MVRNHDSSTRVLTFVLTVVLGLVSVVIGYAIFKNGSFELRSKAAQEEVVLKEWGFKKDNEGWNAEDFESAIVKDGNYSLVVGSKVEEIRYGEEECTGSEKRGNYRCRTPSSIYVLSPRINQNAVNVILKYPVNRFRMRLKLSSMPSGIKPTPTCEPVPPCAYLKKSCKYVQEGVTYCPKVDQPAGTYTGGGGVPPSGNQHVISVPFQISYRLQGKNTDEPPVTRMALADGVMHDVSFNFPKETSLKQVVSMKISFENLRTQAKARVDISDISIAGIKEVKPPAKTYRGMVATVNSAGGTPITDAPYPYRLMVPAPGGVRSPATVYLLSNEAGIDFNFKKYVDKQVVVVGVVKSEDYDERAGIRLPGESLPVLIVSKISLAVVPTVLPIICWNRTDGINWSNGCKGNPQAGLMCTQALVSLSASEITGYKKWVSAGKPFIPGCGMPTVTPNPAKTYRGVVNKSISDNGGRLLYRLTVSTGGASTVEHVLSSMAGGDFNFGNYVGKNVVVEGILSGEEYTDSQVGMRAPGSPGGPYILIVSKISLQ